MKKVNQVWFVAIATIVLIAIFTLLASSESGAQTAPTFPLKAGKIYHAIDAFDRNFEFRVFTPPGSNGWAVVDLRIANSTSNYLFSRAGFSSPRLGLNINQLFFIEELEK